MLPASMPARASQLPDNFSSGTQLTRRNTFTRPFLLTFNILFIFVSLRMFKVSLNFQKAHLTVSLSVLE